MFFEIQRFRQTWIITLLMLLLLLLVGGIILKKWQEIPVEGLFDWPTFISLSVTLLVMALFYFMQLETQIDRKGICYRWVPFQGGYSCVEWDKVEKLEVVTYSPLREYGGWGIRFGRRGRAHNVAGSKGLEIFFKGKRKTLLIGTQKPAALSDFLAENFPSYFSS